jgi:Phage integrase family
MLPALKGHLLRHRDSCGRPGAGELVFRTSRGGPRTKDNVRLRILLPVLVRAEDLLEERDQASLPPGITPHSLRHTFASMLFAIDEDPVSVMRQLGHTDPAFTLRVYAHSWSAAPTSASGYANLPRAARWSASRPGSSNATVAPLSPQRMGGAVRVSRRAVYQAPRRPLLGMPKSTIPPIESNRRTWADSRRSSVRHRRKSPAIEGSTNRGLTKASVSSRTSAQKYPNICHKVADIFGENEVSLGRKTAHLQGKREWS